MLGAILGDIAGSIYEFNNIKTTDFDLLGKGTAFTDDSVLTIAIADWLLMDDELTKDRLIFLIKDYVRRYPHPMGSYGGRFSDWIRNNDSAPYGSWGNGSAMRVTAVGWFFDSLEETENIAKLTAEITHNHPEGIKGAQATAAAIYMARTCATKKDIKEYIESKYGYNLSRTCDEIRPNYTFNESCQETVPEAIIAFLDSVDFESAIRLAVSLGGDSDTLTCITGGIAEAFYGMEMNLPISYSSSSYSRLNFSELTLNKLPTELKQKVDEFYEKIVRRNKIFWTKNESATELKNINWIKTELHDKSLSEESYKSFLKGYGPNWDCRYGVYYEDGWHLIYRSYHLLKKFRFRKMEDGLYHLNEAYCSGFQTDDLIEEVLLHGYFEAPYRYKEFQRS